MRYVVIFMLMMILMIPFSETSVASNGCDTLAHMIKNLKARINDLEEENRELALAKSREIFVLSNKIMELEGKIAMMITSPDKFVIKKTELATTSVRATFWLKDGMKLRIAVRAKRDRTASYLTTIRYNGRVVFVESSEKSRGTLVKKFITAGDGLYTIDVRYFTQTPNAKFTVKMKGK